MYCYYCGNVIDEESQYCSRCGRAVKEIKIDFNKLNLITKTNTENMPTEEKSSTNIESTVEKIENKIDMDGNENDYSETQKQTSKKIVVKIKPKKK